MLFGTCKADGLVQPSLVLLTCGGIGVIAILVNDVLQAIQK